MYPSTYLGLFPAFPKDNRVFVAMSFDPQFDTRWEKVIAPGVSAVLVGGMALEPHRVDMRTVSDSILTEILEGIARCRVFIADISSMGELHGRAVRNANVMYEVGLAHAARLPEEVLLVRSDDRELSFDVANIRIHRYHPDGSPETARHFITDIIASSLKEVDLRKHLAVRTAAEVLDGNCWIVLLEANVAGGVDHPQMKTMGQALGGAARMQAIQRLLELGALRTELAPVTRKVLTRETQVEEIMRYQTTAFGAVLADYGLTKIANISEDVRQALERISKAQRPEP